MGWLADIHSLAESNKKVVESNSKIAEELKIVSATLVKFYDLLTKEDVTGIMVKEEPKR